MARLSAAARIRSRNPARAHHRPRRDADGTAASIPTADRTSQVGFAELSLVLRKELRVGGDLAMLGCGPLVGPVYDVLGAGVVFGAEIVGRYLVQLGNALAVGPFVDVRAVLYDLPGDPRPFYDVIDG